MSELKAKPQHQRLKHLLERCWVYCAVLIIITAIIFSVFRALTPWARQYKPMVLAHLSTMLGQPVSIESMDISWYWLHPVLRLTHVTLTDKDAHELKLNQLLIGINLFSSLWHGSIQPGILYLDHTRFIFRQINDRWQIDGLNISQQDTNVGADAYLPILSWLSLQSKIVVRHVSSVAYLENGSMIPLKHVNMTIQNSGGRYRLKGTAQLNRTSKTKASVFADLYLNPLALKKTKGQVYVSIQSLLPAQWQKFLPKFPVKIKEGKGDISLWLDIVRGRLVKGQSTLTFNQLILKREGDLKPLHLAHISAHVGLKRTKTGWDLDGDHLKLDMNHIKWPENAFYFHYNQIEQGYRMFIKHLLIQPLIAIDIPWPDTFKSMLEMNPEGQLYDTALHVKSQSLDYVLTGFSNLGWQEKGVIPAVSNLSGVLYWRPSEGRLQLDSYQTAIAYHHLPPVLFARINTTVEWEKKKQGTRIHLDHVVLQHQDLSLTANGVLEDAEQYPNSQAHFTMQFSTTRAEQWIKYIPEKILKPKLDRWLKHDIKQIDKLSGQVVIDGRMSDFPFENTPGTFSVSTQWNGVDLIFAPHWPLTRDIDAFLSVDKRNINVDIHHANLSGIAVDNMNLRLDDVGLDYETLLIHGKVKTAGEQLLHYILHSPLGARLSRLKSLDLHGLLALDIQLEIPLYPENDTVLTQGEIEFEHNQARLKLGSTGLILDNLDGRLSFNEKGLEKSKFSAVFAGSPMSVQVQPVQQPNPALQVTFQGGATMETLQQMLRLPLFALLKGALNVDGVLILTDSSKDLDNLQLRSSLQGVQVDLPKPLGKLKETSAPLFVNIDFDVEKAMRLRLSYDNRLSTDLWYDLGKKKSVLHRGEILIGRGEASSPKEKGLKISGVLPLFDEKKWTAAFSKISAAPSGSSLVDSVRWVDVSIDKLNVFHQQVSGVSLKATQLDNHEWAVQIQQKDLTANVRYQPSTHTLSGQVERLHVDNALNASKQGLKETDQLSPVDIPNLHLTIQHLIYGDVDVGQVAVKSKSSKTELDIESGQVSTSSYDLAFQGRWLKGNGVNRTDVKADLTIHHLAEGLERWHLKPAVEANSGSVSFNGGWSGGFSDFSLAKVSGQVQFLLKGGRIKDLGSATEGKIGFGKVLSIFSLQTIPRRLKLDFSDLSQNGYSFDQFKGDFNVKNGVMNTQNSTMDGPVAYVSMKGDVDLLKRLFSLQVNVTPYVMASLPVVATIVGGPVAGIATWAASKIINQGMYKVTAYSYKVTGPWSDPVVEQSSIEKKRVNHR